MGFVRDLTGKTAANRARAAGELQGDAAVEAKNLLNPFAELGQQGLSQAGFLTDPNQQFDFLQNNPLFQLALDNANTQTLQQAAAKGRISSDDTQQALANNVLLQASPLINQQAGAIGSLIDLGVNTAGNQGNLLTGEAAARAGGLVGEGNARGEAAQNTLDLAKQIGALFSDPQLKTNIKKIGQDNGYNIYSWMWNEKANSLGLFGDSKGVMADEVKSINPEAISYDKGFMKVNYGMLGVEL